MENTDIVIIAAKRTPIGNLQGALQSLTAPKISALANKAALLQANIDGASLDEVILGCVLQAGLGQAPARQASLYAGIPNTVPATTINKMCGSGMRAVMFAHDSIKAGQADMILAGGMESMSNAPYLLPKARTGYRLGHGVLACHLFLDGLEDAYSKGQLMGVFAEATAKKFQVSREAQDAYAKESLMRAIKAQTNGLFDAEITPIELTTREGLITIAEDEGPDITKVEKIARLKPAFAENGTITAANSSSISDGAASLIITHAKAAQKHNLKILARIKAHASVAAEPAWFTTAPIEAIKLVLKKTGWSAHDVDLYEINEAFAIVPMLATQALSLDPAKVNSHGGACVLGHPIGASGARILVTLLYALKAAGKKRGIAALCIGGGEASAVALEID